VSPSPPAGPVAVGTVVDFDPAVGLGVVESSGGRYRFHCTQIAGGSRTIAVGTPVRFEVKPGRNGAWEAAGVSPRLDTNERVTSDEA